ncbi:DNA alkylation repair protein [Nocardia sp. BMG51109]|uniref:DNA alkylation repair protein n=1 Tax=Nocardia sp. BMG51109 TaxID=1056816 RepID=UPI0005637CD0|nr:DNA alkylation repair protein [Nocardia sp. BMG51109]
MGMGVPLKETAISPARVQVIAADLAAVYPGFDAGGFVSAVVAKLPQLELKARVAWVADKLAEYLPGDIERAIEVVVSALPAHDDANFRGPDFGLYTYAPYSDFVARYGCARPHLRTSLDALAEMTKHFTAEDALRYFLNAFPDETLASVTAWSVDSDYHVRRLASEGTRPLLPWSPRIALHVTSAIPVLDNLFSDEHRFVTQSVANHLNDISRIDPELVLATLERWRDLGTQSPREMDFIVRQALRTLIKQGHYGAFEFLGLSTSPAVEVVSLALEANDIALGGDLAFTVSVRARRAERVMIDFVVQYARASTGSCGEAVFKLKTLDLPAGEQVVLSKRQTLRPTASRRLGPGPGHLHIQINGTRVADVGFQIHNAALSASLD